MICLSIAISSSFSLTLTLLTIAIRFGIVSRIVQQLNVSSVRPPRIPG